MKLNDASISISSLPMISPFRPAPAPAILKAALEKSIKVKCFTRDYNIDFQHDFVKSSSSLLEFQVFSQLDGRYQELTTVNFKDLLRDKVLELSNINQNLFWSFIKEKATELINLETDWIGLSIFSSANHLFATALIYQIKKRSPTQKIVIGGNGLTNLNFGNYYYDSNIVDAVIYGEGEVALVKLLQHKLSFLGINKNNPVQIKDLNKLPYPDYGDYNLKLYKANPRELPITASRGCIRNCTFCDVHYAWPNYSKRSVKHIVGEIVYLWETKQVFTFTFTDSLINGNLKEFKELCLAIIDLLEQKKLPDQLHIMGQFICWKKDLFDEELYALMSKAKINELFVGIESGSNSVLKDMRKGIKRDDIVTMIHFFHKYNIKSHLLIIIGYITETYDDFMETMNLFKEFKQFSDEGTILSVNLSKTMAILDGSPIAINYKKWGITFPHVGKWLSIKNLSLDYKERIRRRLYAQKIVEDLGYQVRWPIQHLIELEKMIDDV